MKRFVKVSAFIVIFFVFTTSIVISNKSLYSTSKTTRDLLWKQSIEAQLIEQCEQYQNTVYKRYRSIEHDLHNYQHRVSQMYKHLDNRLTELEGGSPDEQ